MVVKIRVAGAEQLRVLAAELRAQGEEGKGFRRKLLAAIRAAAAPAPAAAKASAKAVLPKGGGLNELIAASNIGVRTRLTGKSVGVRIAASKGNRHLLELDAGHLRHKVFGRPKSWVAQEVTPGWFTTPMEEMSPRTTTAVLAAIYATRREIERS